MKIFSVVFFCLLSMPVWSDNSQDLLLQLTKLEKSLELAAKKEGELAAQELNKIRVQPTYKMQYMDPGVVRDYHLEADHVLGEIISLKKQTLAATSMSGSNCAQAITQYHAKTFDKLQRIYRKFVARKPPFPLVSSVFAANQQDSLRFITEVVMSCKM
ncbi:MAG: hypothetical protein KKF24_09845 [Gammaproteobacteria bacterium]|nr:hypothetical protein [Gammaproteobacteria bacterium]MBU1832985.1 hypothetical protein [Gammaproteobacteria bacterium]